MNIDGSGEQKLATGWRQMKSPTWSADGNGLVFSWQNGGRLDEEKRRVDLAEAARNEDGVNIPGNARDIDRDGSVIEFTVPADAHWSLKELNLATGQLNDPATGQYNYGPSGHPTSANLFIFRGREGLGLYDAYANAARPITSDFRDRAAVISPDGSQIALTYWQNDHWEIHTMNSDGSNRRRLTETPLSLIAENTQPELQAVDGKERIVPRENPHWNNAAPAWSPAGTQIAFVTDRTGQWEIWLMNSDGSNQRPMFPNGALKELSLNYAGVDERMISWR
jgi:Tol biopolymer transport system component